MPQMRTRRSSPVSKVHARQTTSDRSSTGFLTEYRNRYDSLSIEASNPHFPFFTGVWDTVRALGVPGSSGLVFWCHAFHDATLNPRVPHAHEALSIDENRQIFAPGFGMTRRNCRKPRRA